VSDYKDIFTEEELDLIEHALNVFNGKIVFIKDIKQ
jgi:hypothetical protein